MANRDELKARGPLYRVVRFILLAIRNYFTFIGALVTLGPILVMFILAKQAEGPGGSSKLKKDHPARLTLELTGKVSESEPDFTQRIVGKFFGGEHEIYLPELRTALRKAALDDRVTGLFLNVGMMAASPADFAELHRILDDFRDSKKPIDVVVTDAEDWNYYIASAGTKLVLNPASPVILAGPSFQLIYFGEALKKIGVDIDVVRAGKYKSAFEPLVQNQPSEPTLEEYHSMQKSLVDHVIEAVAKSRGKDVATVRSWYTKSIYTANEAKAQGMVDAIGYDEFVADADKTPEMTVGDYLSSTRRETDVHEAGGTAGIGLIEAVGEINMTEKSGPSSDEGIAPRSMTKRIRWAMENDDVKAVVLRVSSPGGSAIASDVIWNELKKLAAKKPMVVSMGTYAASGGYYISVPAKKLIAEPTTLTGSIGVIGMLPSFKPFEEKYGVSFHIVSSSDRRNMLNPGSKATPEDKALIDSTIDQVYQTFLSRVAEGRHMKIEDVAKLAQGRVYTGLQAKELGLVDDIGGIGLAFREAKKYAGLDPDKLYPVLHYEDDEMSLEECIKSPTKMMKCLQAGDVASGLGTLLPNAAVDDAAVSVKRWVETAQHEHALAIWPGYLSIKTR